MKKIMYVMLIISIIITIYFNIANIMAFIYDYIPPQFMEKNVFIRIASAIILESYIKLFLQTYKMLFFIFVFNLVCFLFNMLLKNIRVLWFTIFLALGLFNMIIYLFQTAYR